MFYLILAIVCNCAETIAVRFSERNLHNRYAVTMFNYAVAAIAAYFFIGDHALFNQAAEYHLPIALGIFNGTIFIAWFLLFQISIKHNGPPLSIAFTKLGVLFPTFGSILLFAEAPGLVQVLGIALAVISIVLFNLPEKNASLHTSEKQAEKYKLLLLLLLIIGGTGDFNSKVFENFGNAELANLFLFYTFLVALLLSIAIWFFKNRTVSKSDVIFGLLIGLPNQLTAMFLLWALLRLPAYFVFPAHSVGVILLVSIVNSLLFKEKLSRLQRISMALVCAALICLNVG